MTNKVDHTKRKHALCGASNSDRWLACPGSVAMSLSPLIPEGEESAYAKEGTRAHELADKILLPMVFHWNKTGGKDMKAIADMINTKDLPGLKISEYPEEMREHIEDYVELVWGKVLKYKPKKIFVEQRVTLSEDLGLFGTADCFFAFRAGEKTVMLIIDLKYGAGHPVEADSPQLKYYAAAVQNTYPKVEFDEFWLCIFQPRAEHESGPYRRYIAKKAEIKKFAKKFVDGAKKAMAETKKGASLTLCAGDHCKFCPAKPICTEHAKYLDNKAGLDFTDDPAVLVPAIPDQRKEIIHCLSDEQIKKLLLAQKEIESFFSALKEYGINRFQEGNPIAGMKVVEGRSTRVWSGDEETVASALQDLGVEEPYNRKLKGITDISREVKKAKGLKGKEGDEEVKKILNKLVAWTMPPLVLVADEDSRPAITNTDAKDDFNDGVVSPKER